MANKTIYFKDDALWAKAKELAGNGGLSAVIQAAVERFTKEAEQQQDGLRRFALDVDFANDQRTGDFGTTERIAFDGELLVEMKVGVVALLSRSTEPGTDPEPPTEEFLDGHVACYRTRGKRLVFTLEELAFTDGGGINYYAVVSSVSELRKDPELNRVHLFQRREFLKAVSEKLGEDWAIWID